MVLIRQQSGSHHTDSDSTTAITSQSCVLNGGASPSKNDMSSSSSHHSTSSSEGIALTSVALPPTAHHQASAIVPPLEQEGIATVQHSANTETKEPVKDLAEPRQVAPTTTTSTIKPANPKSKIPQEQSATPQGRNLFVASLPRRFTNEDLTNLFSPFGSICSAKIMMDLATGKSRQFGFVLFDKAEDAKAAQAQLSRTKIADHKQPLHVSFASHDDTLHEVEGDRLYVRNLPAGTTMEQLGEVFAKFAPLRECSLLPDRHGSNTRGVAFIRFSSVATARDAKTAMQNSKVFGDNYPLMIRFMENGDLRNRRRDRKASDPPAPASGTVSASGASSETEDVIPSPTPGVLSAQQYPASLVASSPDHPTRILPMAAARPPFFPAYPPPPQSYAPAHSYGPVPMPPFAPPPVSSATSILPTQVNVTPAPAPAPAPLPFPGKGDIALFGIVDPQQAADFIRSTAPVSLIQPATAEFPHIIRLQNPQLHAQVAGMLNGTRTSALMGGNQVQLILLQ